MNLLNQLNPQTSFPRPSTLFLGHWLTHSPGERFLIVLFAVKNRPNCLPTFPRELILFLRRKDNCRFQIK